jgi:vancomycin permeability regulator SanA
MLTHEYTTTNSYKLNSLMDGKRILKFILAMVLIWLAAHLLYITIDGLTASSKQAELAVVFGNKVNPDGTLSQRLQKRLECALILYRSGRIEKIMVSGGLGKEGFYEGDKMKEFLINKGVPAGLIIVDNKGNNTIATVNNVIRLKDSLNYHSIMIVSQYYHITRIKMLFRTRSIQSVCSISPAYFELRDAYSLLSEFVAFYTEILFQD